MWGRRAKSMPLDRYSPTGRVKARYSMLRAEIVAALAALTPDESNGN